MFKTTEQAKNISLSDLIRRHGTHSLCYAALQPGLKYFMDEEAEGFIAYRSCWGTDYVLGEPIAAKEDKLYLTRRFLKSSPRAVFLQIGSEYARTLLGFGYSINGFGVEHFLDLEEFVVSWKVRRNLKRISSKLRHQGCFVFDSFGQEEDISRVNAEYLISRSKGREFSFLVRPFETIHEEGTHYFTLFHQKEVIGFVSYDPVYNKSLTEQSETVVVQHLRTGKNAPQGAADFLLLETFDLLRQKGVQRVSLGLSPLYQRDSGGFPGSWLAEAVFSLLEPTKFLYHFKQVGEHKDRYHTRKRQTYLALPTTYNLKNLIGILKVNGLI